MPTEHSETVIPLRKLQGVEMTIRAYTTPEYRVRRWVAVRLIALAARVLGAKVRVEVTSLPTGGVTHD